GLRARHAPGTRLPRHARRRRHRRARLATDPRERGLPPGGVVVTGADAALRDRAWPSSRGLPAERGRSLPRLAGPGDLLQGRRASLARRSRLGARAWRRGVQPKGVLQPRAQPWANGSRLTGAKAGFRGPLGLALGPARIRVARTGT